MVPGFLPAPRPAPWLSLNTPVRGKSSAENEAPLRPDCCGATGFPIHTRLFSHGRETIPVSYLLLFAFFKPFPIMLFAPDLMRFHFRIFLSVATLAMVVSPFCHEIPLSLVCRNNTTRGTDFLVSNFLPSVESPASSRSTSVMRV